MISNVEVYSNIGVMHHAFLLQLITAIVQFTFNPYMPNSAIWCPYIMQMSSLLCKLHCLSFIDNLYLYRNKYA